MIREWERDAVHVRNRETFSIVILLSVVMNFTVDDRHPDDIR